MHLLQEQNERFTERWTEQAAAFSKVLKTSLQASAGTSKYNSVKLPTFSDEFNEDVNEFLTNFDRAANFHNCGRTLGKPKLALCLFNDAVSPRRSWIPDPSL